MNCLSGWNILPFNIGRMSSSAFNPFWDLVRSDNGRDFLSFTKLKEFMILVYLLTDLFGSSHLEIPAIQMIKYQFYFIHFNPSTTT
jgi:hypothetical protein